jgi:CRP-like cAMP-binding protein
MPKSIPTILSLSEFFHDLTDVQLKLIASICEPAVYKRGHVLIKENERTDDLYVVGEGEVEILMNPGLVSGKEDAAPIVVARVGPGQSFGEIALVDHGMRSATARVSENKTQVLKLSGKRLMLLCDTYPELGYTVMKNLAADLALKIRIANLTHRQVERVMSRGSR